MSDFETPEDLRYTPDHEWVRDEDGVLRVGITAFAQDALGDIVYVSLPEEGAHVEAGQPCGEVESTKSVSDLYAPVSGTVVTRNADLDTAPEQVNTDPYGQGWMLRIRPDDPAEVGGLLSAGGYRDAIRALDT
jgi:glycine cleavage system H protein